VVVLDTCTRRELASAAYNERRAACERAAIACGVPALRDATCDDLGKLTDPRLRKRARHVISENARTRAAADALARGDAREVGALMNESHASLRNDYEVSREELDIVVQLAQEHPACFGARMTGAGFGGCAVAIARRDAARTFAQDVAQLYERRVRITPSAYVCSAASGASIDHA
jgi:galactokinase